MTVQCCVVCLLVYLKHYTVVIVLWSKIGNLGTASITLNFESFEVTPRFISVPF